MTERLIPFNQYTRSGTKLRAVNGVVVHYVQWPGVSADRVARYFAEEVPREERYGSAHYVIGLDGEILRLIPEDEVAYHAGPSRKTHPNILALLHGYPNWHTIGIECCHEDESGEFRPETRRALWELVSDLCYRYDIEPLSKVLRHFDCTGKECPLYFVDNPRAWECFKTAVLHELKFKVVS